MTRYSKFIAAALAFVGVIVASGLLHGQAQAWASCILSAIGAALVYLVPNLPQRPKRNERGAVDLDEMERRFAASNERMANLVEKTIAAAYRPRQYPRERGASDVYVLVVVVLLVLILLAVVGVL